MLSTTKFHNFEIYNFYFGCFLIRGTLKKIKFQIFANSKLVFVDKMISNKKLSTTKIHNF